MRPRTNALLMIMAAVLALGLSAGYAQAKKSRLAKREQKAFAKLQAHAFKGINLSTDQKSTIWTEFVQYYTQAMAWRKANRPKIRSLKKQIREAQKANDSTKVQQLHDQLTQLKASGPKLADALRKMRNELTPA